MLSGIFITRSMVSTMELILLQLLLTVDIRRSTDRTIDLLAGLQEQLLKFDSEFLQASQLVAELDCLMAFASASRDFNLVRPNMTESNVIKIQRGRHLLHEIVSEVYVPNDTLLQGGTGISAAEEIHSESSQAETTGLVKQLKHGFAAFLDSV